MIDISKNSHSLTEFKHNPTEFIEHIKKTKQPIILTIDGKAELIIQDAESYQALLEAAELVKTLKHPLRSAKGLCADLKVDISQEDIAEIRREMWSNFNM